MGQKSPRYLDVASSIQKQIDDLGPNALLPTEEQFANRLEVSRVTVRTALDLLERCGSVTRYRGRGTVVSPPKITRRFSPLYSFEQDMVDQGISFETKILETKKEMDPPKNILNELDLPMGSKVKLISLIRIVNYHIVSHEQRYYPPKIANLLDPALLEHQDASNIISEIAGGAIEEVDWISEIITSSKSVAVALEIVPRTLILANAYTWRMKEGVPIESGTISYRVDRCRFKHEARFNQSKV